jgi:hypothetical protein
MVEMLGDLIAGILGLIKKGDLFCSSCLLIRNTGLIRRTASVRWTGSGRGLLHWRPDFKDTVFRAVIRLSLGASHRH